MPALLLDGFGPLYAAGRPSNILSSVTASQCSPAGTTVRNSAHWPLTSPLLGNDTFAWCISLPSIQNATVKGSEPGGRVPRITVRKTYSPCTGKRCQTCRALG